MKPRAIVSRARIVLNDADGTRWPDAELALWTTDAERTTIVRRPDSGAKGVTFTCAAGSKQSIAGLSPVGLRLLDVVRTATGRHIRLTDGDALDTHRPGWSAATQGIPVNWVYDSRVPQTFYVYPPAIVGTEIDIVYVPRAAEVTAANLDTLDMVVDDAFSGALLNYVLYRAYAKDSDNAHNATLAAMYLAAFEADLGGKGQADMAYSPDMNSAGGKPTPGSMSGGV